MNIPALFDIAGKRALVTGGSGGIGLMIATGLVAAGAEVLICSRKGDAVDAAVTALSADGGRIGGVAADLASDAGIAAVAAAVGAAPLHILVNNAGAAWGAPLAAFPRAGFDKVIGLNVTAPFLLVQALLPALRAAATPDDPARVINIASVDGLRLPNWETYSYSASKAAIIHMGRHMARTLAPDDIAVNAIAPGFFRSRMTEGVFDWHDEAAMAEARSPLGARTGGADDIVGAVIYLASRAGAWLTGVTIPVAGGLGTID